MARILAIALFVTSLVLPAASAHTGGRPGLKAGNRSSKGVTVILVVDRSGSMSGQKIDRTRKAAALVIGRLRKTDWVGVLAFDTTPRVLSPLSRVGNRKAHLTSVGRLTAGGGTSFLPVLHAALKMINLAPAGHRRHVIFLSDGQSGRLGVMSAIHALVRARATLSTIALGQGADTVFLGKMARIGKGRAHATTSTGLAAVCRKELRHVGR